MSTSKFSADPSQTPDQPVEPQQPWSNQPPAEQKFNTLSIVSFVTAFFVSIAAVICGHIALSQIKKTGERGHGLALAGTILGYLGIVAGLIVGGLMIAGTIGAVSEMESLEDSISESQSAVSDSDSGAVSAAEPGPLNAEICNALMDSVAKMESSTEAYDEELVYEAYESMAAAGGPNAQIYADFVEALRSNSADLPEQIDAASTAFSDDMVSCMSISQ